MSAKNLKRENTHVCNLDFGHRRKIYFLGIRNCPFCTPCQLCPHSNTKILNTISEDACEGCCSTNRVANSAWNWKPAHKAKCLQPSKGLTRATSSSPVTGFPTFLIQMFSVHSYSASMIGKHCPIGNPISNNIRVSQIGINFLSIVK